MGVSIRYCSKCGVRIDPEDFESGRAYREGGYAYCANCAPAPARSHRTAAGRQHPGPRKFVRKGHRPGWSGIRKEHRVGEHERYYPQTAPAKRKSPALLIAVVGIAVFVIIVVIAVSARRGPQEVALVEDQIAPVEPPVVRRGIEQPSAPSVRQKTPSEKRLEDALSYARSHPEEFDKVLDMLEAIEREEMTGGDVSLQIGRYISEFMGRRDAAAKEKWDKVAQQASAAEKSGDIAKAISIYQSIPEICAKHTTYSARAREEVERLKTFQEAKAAFVQVEPLLSAIDPGKGLEELKKMREQIADFCAKYEGTEYVQKLKEPLAKLDEIIADLEQKVYEEEQKRREEEVRRRQEELAKEEAEKRAKEWQQQKDHLEKFWAENNFDANALPELQIGKAYRLFNGADTTGWLVAVTRDCDWSVQNGELVGSNRSPNQSGLLIPNYKRQYFWENYTFECKVMVSRGTGAVMVRANVNENNVFCGTVHPIRENQWVSVKMVVKDDQVDASIDGGQPQTYRGNTWHAGFVALAVDGSSEVRFKDLSITLDSVKPVIR